MVSEVMQSGNWSTVTLGEICDRIRLKNQGKTDNVLTISGQHGLVSQTKFFNKSVASKNLDGYILLTKGDFAYNKSYSDGYPFGAIKRLEKYEQGIVSTLYLCFRPKTDVSGDFLKHYFDSNLWHSEVREIAQEGGRSHGLLNVGVEDFFGISLTVPPLPEQRKIAAILTSVDDAIAATQRIIDQTEVVKRGLMQQLLTRGIGHTTFKQTEIGEIPTEWDVAQIGKVCQTTSGGTPKRSVKVYYENGTIPWIKTGELGIKYIYDSEERITNEAVRNSSAKILPQNTVLVAMYGATIGKSSILKIEAATNQACCAILCDEKKVHHEFLYYILSFRKDELVNLGAGGAQPNISQQLIKRFSIPIPPIEEQRQIAVILASIDDKLQHEHKTLQTYSSLKVSLMNVLLTGKVRVNVDEPSEVSV